MTNCSRIHALLVGDFIAARALAEALRRQGVAVEHCGSSLQALRRSLIADRDRTSRLSWRVMFVSLDEATYRASGDRLPTLIDQLGAVAQLDAIIGLAASGRPSSRDAALGLNLYTNDVAGAIAILESLVERRWTQPASVTKPAHHRIEARDEGHRRRGADDRRPFIGQRQSLSEPIQVHHSDEKCPEAHCNDSRIVVTKGICDVEERMAPLTRKRRVPSKGVT